MREDVRELVRLRTRPSRDDRTFKYQLDYVDGDGKRRRVSLGHADRKKAERQRTQKDRELRMGVLAPESMKLSDFLDDSLTRTGKQIRESTQTLRREAVEHFIRVIGDVDYQRITLRHAELFRQACLDQGNNPATVSKKLRQLKTTFQLAVDRKQLEENPFKRIQLPKSPKKKIRVLTMDECERLIEAARYYQQRENSVEWELLFRVALTTGMRRSELLNTIWTDIDFDGKTIDVSPKKDTTGTWEWHIKDTDSRTLGLTDEDVLLLSDHQAKQPEGYPYVFVPVRRYDHIQQLRTKKQGKWTLSDARLKVVNNFDRRLGKILKRAGVKNATFHDLRSTAITNWFRQGLKELEVMKLAGHSSFATTHQFYLAVADDLVDRARQAAAKGFGEVLARARRAPSFVDKND